MAGALAIAATAWLGRDLSQLEAQPVVFGLAYLAFAIAVAMRFGAIPFHLWAARLTDVVPETALPVLTAFAPASLAVVALAWIASTVAPLSADLTLERYVVLAIAIATIVLAAVAAFVQDDLEHVLGYSIVGDAGVIILALAVRRARRPGAGADVDPGVHRGPWRVRGLGRRDPGRVLHRSGRATCAAGRGAPRSWPSPSSWWPSPASASRVWPRSRPVRHWSAWPCPRRSTCCSGSSSLVPVIYYGRLLVIGLSPPDRVGEPLVSWRPHAVRPDLTSLRHWSRQTWDANRAFTTASVAALLGLLALATAAGAFGGTAAAAEPIPTVTIPGASAAPGPSFGVPAPRVSPSPSPSPTSTGVEAPSPSAEPDPGSGEPSASAAP